MANGSEISNPRGTIIAIIAIVVVAITAMTIIVMAALGWPKLDGGQNGNAENEGIVINDKVVVYEEDSAPFKIIASDEESVTVSSMDGIADDTILCAGVTPATPSGLLRKVGSHEQVEGGYRIKTLPAALTDAIDQCDIEATVTFKPDGSYEVTERNNASRAVFPVEQAFADEVIGVEIGKSGDNYDLSAEFSLDVSLKIDWGKVDMSMTAHAYAGCKAWLDFSTNAEADIPFLESKKAITVCAGPVPIVFVNSLEGVLHLFGEITAGKVEAGATLDKSFGFRYTSDGGLTPINEDNSQSPGISFETGNELVNSILEAEPKLELSTLIYGLAGPSLDVGVKAEAEAGFTPLLDGGNHPDAFTIPGTQIQAKGSISARVTVPISGHFVLEIPMNPFDHGQTERIADATLFDTDDEILLWSFEKNFGNDAASPGNGQDIVGKWYYDIDPTGAGGASRPIYYALEVLANGTATLTYNGMSYAKYSWTASDDGSSFDFTQTSREGGTSYAKNAHAYLVDNGGLEWNGDDCGMLFIRTE